MLPYRAANELRLGDFRVKLEDRPGWVWGSTRVPLEGEEIFCAAGAGTVTALHGKTGDGSRLLQIGLASAVKQPYFAAASNVLVAPAASILAEESATRGAGSHAPDNADIWLGRSGGAIRLG